MKAGVKYYEEIAQRLLPLCDGETVIEDGEDKRQIWELGNKIGHGLKIDPGIVIPKMMELGLLIPIEKSPYPEAFFLKLKATKTGKSIDISTKTLQKLAIRLRKIADQEETEDTKGSRLQGKFMHKDRIETTLKDWGHQPGLLIPLMIAKNYLRQRSKQPSSYWIFQTQK